MLEVLRVHKADLSDFITLDDYNFFIIDGFGNFLADFVYTDQSEAFSLYHVFLLELGMEFSVSCLF